MNIAICRVHAMPTSTAAMDFGGRVVFTMVRPGAPCPAPPRSNGLTIRRAAHGPLRPLPSMWRAYLAAKLAAGGTPVSAKWCAVVCSQSQFRLGERLLRFWRPLARRGSEAENGLAVPFAE